MQRLLAVFFLHKWGLCLGSAVLSVTDDRPTIHDQGKGKEGADLPGNASEGSATHEYGADGVDEVVYGIDVRSGVCPRRHGADWGVKSAHQNHDHHDEPYYEDCLLHGVVVVGDDESQTAEHEGEEEREEVYQAETATDVIP